MSDTTTELEVLNQIVDVLGGTSGQYETVVPTLQQILALLGGGGGGGGYNPAASVGRADALTGADSTAQWAQRVTEGSGSATVRSVQGAAVVWNQLNKNGQPTTTYNGVTLTKNNDGSWTTSGVATANGDIAIQRLIPAQVGNKLLVKGCSAGGSASTYYLGVSGSMTDTGNGGIVSAISANNLRFDFKIGCDFDANPITIWPQIFDLTAMFGAGNEPSTVAEFERMYPASYYPYSAPTLKPVRIAGIQSKDAQGNALDNVEWTAFTLRGAGTIGDMLYSDHVETRVGVVDLGTLTWAAGAESNPRFQAQVPGRIGENNVSILPNLTTNAPYTATSVTYFDSHVDEDMLIRGSSNTSSYIFVRNLNYPLTVEGTAAFKASLSGYLLYYELETPATTPISPALPMTYRVQQGGSESIIVPDGEISAIPVLTIAEGESAADLVMDALAAIAAPDGPTATANHSVGTYLTMQGKLYKVTSAIAVGETIVAGTNVSETTVMAELIARTA